MTFTSNARFALIAGCFSLLTIAAPAPDAFAQSEIGKPLHLKMNAKNKNSAEHITITTARHNTGGTARLVKNSTTDKPNVISPAQTNKKAPNHAAQTKATTPGIENKTPLPIQQAKIPPAPKHIETQECHEVVLPVDESDKTTADSLRLYMKDNGQNTQIVDDLEKASREAGVNFELLAVKAMIESDLGRVTQAKHSSARGVFQYIDTTWLALLDKNGQKIGQIIGRDIDTLSNAQKLDLRYDGFISALVKAYQVKDETDVLKRFKGKDIRITATDHYIAHMMGLPLARIFYDMLSSKSPIVLANLSHKGFRQAVKLNPSFFYSASKQGLTAEQAYDHFREKVDQKYSTLSEIHAFYKDDFETTVVQKCHMPEVKTASVYVNDVRTSLHAVDAALEKYKVSAF